MKKQLIEQGKTALGIEFGSTRIKAVLIGFDNHTVLASGSFDWENKLEKGYWTYSLEAVWAGVQTAYAELAKAVKEQYDVELTTTGALGFSAMMHGYLPFDKDGNQLAAFRTWRNTSTEQAAVMLTEKFNFNIPQRWSIAHLYQALLNEETHVKDIAHLTTLAGYVHWKLTGEKVMGVGEASGMFPIDSQTGTYHAEMVDQFNELVPFEWNLETILPTVLSAGEAAGTLTEAGALLLDPTGTLQAGIPIAPPEGDAGTGMVATNSVAERTGNVSAGTSDFAMVVLEKELEKVHMEIDMVTTPTGKPVAMVHCNNFTSDINAWAGLFAETARAIGADVDMGHLYTTLFEKAMEADADLGGLMNINYFSGEPITGFEEGRPLFVRMPDSRLTLANFMRTQIYSALGTLKIGMDILTKEEKVKLDNLLGHGGFFKTERVGQQIMADAMEVPVSLMETAGEGGPWGMALLAAYLVNKESGESLEKYLDTKVFAGNKGSTLAPDPTGVASFNDFMVQYREALHIERAAIKHMR